MNSKYGYTLIALISAASVAALGCDAGSGPVEDSGSTSAGTGGSGSGSGNGSGSGSGNGSGSGSGNGSGSGSGGSGGVTIADMIDDLEDGDSSILANGGRIGAWYTYNDETEGGVQSPASTGEFAPTDGGPSGSSYSAQTAGSGFVEWGAGMGFDLNNMGDGKGGAGIKEKHDGSKHTGIAFYAKGTTPVRFKLLTIGVTPTAEGGTCEMECSDAHGKVIALSSDWTQFVIPFADMYQEGWGTAADFDATALVGIQFQVAKATDFDFEVDQIGFY